MFIFPRTNRYVRDFLMNKYQKWLVVSIVFLAASLVLPIFVLYNALGETLRNAANTIPDYSANNPQTGSIDLFIQQQQAAQAQLLLILLAVEAVLVVAFAVSFWYAIKCRDQCRNFPSPTPKQ